MDRYVNNNGSLCQTIVMLNMAMFTGPQKIYGYSKTFGGAELILRNFGPRDMIMLGEVS